MNNEETFAPEYYGEEEMNRVEAHIEKYFGPSDSVFHEIISPDIHVDIVMIPPREGRDYYTLATMGMGAHVMDVPDEMREDGRTRAELLINLPPDWKLGEGENGWGATCDGEEDADERYYWPVRWLKILARMPGEYGVWLGSGHTIPTGDPLPGTDFSCMLLLNPGAFDSASQACDMPDGSKVIFYQVVPIYEDEMEYKLENGADALLELLNDEMLDVVNLSRPNVCADADPLKGIPFTSRIENFRAWFEENESTLAKMASGKKGLLGGAYDREEIVEFISQGTSLVSKKIFFNIGGDREFAFAVEGKSHLFFLYPRIVAAMKSGSSKTLEKWTFNPWMQGSGGNAVGIDIYGVKVDTDGVLVGIEAADESDGASVSLRFYSKELAPLEEDQRLSAFYILLNNSVGEGLAHRCVDSVERADAPEEGMFPMTELASRLRERLGDDGAPFDPSDRYFSYSREAEEGGGLRGDVFMGTTQHMPLLKDYYNGSVETWRAFAAFGAKPVFIYYYPDPEMEGRERVDQRYDIQDAIEAEVLGERGSGAEIGIVLGGAMGEERAYIDLLLYDEDAFMSRVGAILERYDRVFFISEFRPGGKVAPPRFQSTTPGLFEKLSNLHDAGEHVETAEAIAAIPQEERSYEIQSLFGRALNNIERYEEALNILETVGDRGESDPVWHFRVGYALYFLDREREAADHFQRAVDLGMDDEKTMEFLRDSLAYADRSLNNLIE